MSRSRILLVEDEPSLRRVMEVRLQQAGYDVVAAESGESALTLLETESPDLVITDLRLPGVSGLEILRRTRVAHADVAVILLTAFGTVETAVEAMKAGAYDYLTKPVDADELLLVVARGLEHRSLRQEVSRLRTTIDRKFGFESILGDSPTLLAVLDLAGRAAASEATVLIHGETGTGKELLAKAIHFNSKRREQPMVTINCGAIPKELLESELFGHVKGSFTGAVANKKGRVEAADGGTLFLDEIGEMPLELQVKLLRLLQQREIEKVGGADPVKVDVRIIAATHRNLQAMVEDDLFREDLYYRLNVIPLELPPLRERASDVAALTQEFFLRARERHGRPELVLPEWLWPHFTQYRWPGNIRELENIVERITVLARGPEITLADLPAALREAPLTADKVQVDLPPQGISLEGVERDLIRKALEKFNWNQSQAARYLDISRKTLIYRMEKFGLQRSAGATSGID